MLSLPTSNRRWVRTMVPIGAVMGMGYIDFAAYYSLGYQEIYHHGHKAVAISLWVVLTLCQIILFIYWGTLLLAGPGSYPPQSPYDLYNTGDGEPLPEYFMCDQYGYPIWCSNCQSMKLPRSKHYSKLNRCIPKMDHFCIWVGDVIGAGNYVYFLKFMMWYNIYFIVILCYLSCFTTSNITRGDINHNFIVLYILAGFWILVLSSMLISNVIYITSNITTIDDLARNSVKRQRRRGQINPSELDPGTVFINIKHGDLRLVVECSVFDNMFNFGFKKNWINIFYYFNSVILYPDNYYTNLIFLKSIVVCLVPFLDILFYHTSPTDEYYPSLGPAFNQQLHDKIVKKACYLPSYVKQDPHA